MTQNLLPTRQDRRNQNLYRQLNMGYTPFIGAFRAASVDNLDYQVQGVSGKGSDYFEWGPSMGTGRPWGFAGTGAKVEADYTDQTMLPWLHWLYKGDIDTWATLALAFRKSQNTPLEYPQPTNTLKTFVSTGLLRKGLTKPKDPPIGITSSEDKTQKLRDLFDPAQNTFDGLWVQELERLAALNQIPSTRKEINTKKLIGGESKNPKWDNKKGAAAKWRVPSGIVKEETEKLVRKLTADVLEQFIAPDANDIPGSMFNEYKPYKAESMEETGVALLMDMINEKRGSSIDANVQDKWQKIQGGYQDSDRQFFKGSKIGDLTDEARASNKMRQNVDISTKGLEGTFVYFAKEHNKQLDNLIRMGQDASVGIEITALDIFDKGGYKTEEIHSTIDEAISSIDDLNQQQIDLIKDMLKENNGDLEKAVTAIERTSKKEANLKTSQDYLEFQARQTGVRLLDAAFDGVDSTVGFEFIAPTQIGTQNYLVSFGFTVEDIYGEWVIEKTKPVAEEMENGMQFFLDLLGSVSMGGDAEWLEWRDANLSDTLMREVIGSSATDDLLYDFVKGEFSANVNYNVYPETVVGYKVPKEIDDNLSKLFRANIERNMGKNEFMPWVKRKTQMMTNLWKSASKTDTWEGTREVMQNQNPFEGTQLQPSGNDSVNQWMLPFASFGRTAGKHAWARASDEGWSF